MAQHEIKLTFAKELEVLNKDVAIAVKRDEKPLGTLTLSRGSIDWLPTGRHRGKRGETQLPWAKFAEVMQKALEEKNARKRPRPRKAVAKTRAI